MEAEFERVNKRISDFEENLAQVRAELSLSKDSDERMQKALEITVNKLLVMETHLVNLQNRNAEMARSMLDSKQMLQALGLQDKRVYDGLAAKIKSVQEAVDGQAQVHDGLRAEIQAVKRLVER